MQFMKRFLTIGLIALLVSAGTNLYAEIPPGEPLLCSTLPPEKIIINAWESVGVNIWLLQGKPDAMSSPINQGMISNVVFVADPTSPSSDGWLIGSGPSADAGRALACSVKRSLGYTVTDLVSVRAYPESVLGAAGLPKVRHWALPQVQAAMKERCTHCLKRLEVAVNTPTPLVQSLSLPDHLIQSAQLGPFDVLPVEVQPNQSVALLYHRASHTWLLPGVVWGHGLAPQLRDADTEHLLSVLGQLSQRGPVHVIPEQGAANDGSLIQENIAYWQRLIDSVSQRWRSGDSQPHDASGLSAAQALVADPETRRRDFLNAQRAWQEVEHKEFGRPRCKDVLP